MVNKTDPPAQQGGDISVGDITHGAGVAIGPYAQANYIAINVAINSYPEGIYAQTDSEAELARSHEVPPETLRRLLASLSALASDPTSVYEDVPLPLGGLEQFAWSYPSPDVPKGWVNLGGVGFQLQPTEDRRAVGLAVRPSPQNQPETISVPVGLANVGSVFMLITTGWGLKRIEGLSDGWEGEQVGMVRLCFEDGGQQEQQLVLGDNIRDWAIGNTEWAVTETTAPNTVPVWVSPGGDAALDLLHIDIDGGPKTLERIEIVAQMVSLKGQTLLPAELREGDKLIAPPSFAIIQVSGIACRVPQD
jgi:hypothetical protein